MINFKNILIILLCCLLFFSASNIAGTLYCDSYCDGGSGWSGGSGGSTPPDCDTYVSTRTLGSCAGPGEDGETCYENSMTTKHTKTYILEEDGPCLVECGLVYLVCIGACNYIDPEDMECGAECLNERANCESYCLDCLIMSDTYSDSQDGCK